MTPTRKRPSQPKRKPKSKRFIAAACTEKKRHKTYSPAQLEKAVNALWDCTARLRSQYADSGKWPANLGKLIAKHAKANQIPHNTLKYNFLKRANVHAPDQLAKQQKRADAASLLTAIEKRTLYDWIEYMRKRFLTPTRDDLRAQVLT